MKNIISIGLFLLVPSIICHAQQNNESANNSALNSQYGAIENYPMGSNNQSSRSLLTGGESEKSEKYIPKGTISYTMKKATYGNITSTEAEQNNKYIIQRNDCLWNLAGKFLKNPFLWPQIWHHNRYISNPHLIYPGDVLVIPVIPADAGYLGGYPPKQRVTLAPTLLSELGLSANPNFVNTGNQVFAPGRQDIVTDIASFLQLKTIFTSDFLFNTALLWFEDELKENMTVTAAVLRSPTNSIPKLFDEITAKLEGYRKFHVADTIDIIVSRGRVNLDNRKAICVQRIGKASITSVEDDKITAKIFDIRDVISPKFWIAPSSPLQAVELDTFVEAQNEISAIIIKKIAKSYSAQLFNSFIIDKGTRDGIGIGDCFAVYAMERKKESKYPLLIGCVMHAEEVWSTLSIIKLFSDSFSEGDKALLLKKARCLTTG